MSDDRRFPVDPRTAVTAWLPAADVIPQLCAAVMAVPLDVWNAHDDLYALADAIEPWLKRHSARKWDFIWSMERHFSEPYGPLPKARQSFMAGIPDMFLGEASGAPGDEVAAKPFQYEAGDAVPDEYRLWLEKMFFAHGECMMPYFGSAAKGHVSMFAAIDEFLIYGAPTPEARLRMSNFTAEEFRHTYQFYRLYHDFDPKIPVAIYEHEREVFRAYESFQSEYTWVDRSVANMLADRFGVYQGFEWVQASYAPLARVSLQVVKDERGHSNCGYVNLREVMELEGASARRDAQRLINESYYPFFIASFGSDDSRNNRMWRRWGLKRHTNAQLRAAYHAEMSNVFESLGLETPDLAAALALGLQKAEDARKKGRTQKVTS